MRQTISPLWARVLRDYCGKRQKLGKEVDTTHVEEKEQEKVDKIPKCGTRTQEASKTEYYRPIVIPILLFACLFPSSLLGVRDHFVHQQSPLLHVPRQPWILCHWSVWPVLDIVCPSSHLPASSSLPIKSTFQYFCAHISGSDHMTNILKLTSLYSCQQSFLRLYFLQHRCISPTCRPAYPQQSSMCCHLKTSYSSYVNSL